MRVAMRRRKNCTRKCVRPRRGVSMRFIFTAGWRCSRGGRRDFMAPAKLNESFRAAISHHDAGRYAEAEKLYAKVCAAAPRSFDALHLYGWLALQQGRAA